MKKKVIIVFLSAFCLFPVVTNAMSISAGPYVWYAWWDSSFARALVRDNIFLTYFRPSISINPSFLYGPVLSVNFNERVSWSTVFVTGEFGISSRSIVTSPMAVGTIAPLSTSQEVRRYDVDSALNYKFLDWLKLFVGIKYQHYSIDHIFFIPNSMLSEYEYSNHGISAAVGPGFTFHLGGAFYLLCNVSALYQYLIIDKTGYIMPLSSAIRLPANQLVNYHLIGANATASIAYYISGLSTTINLGFRYQYAHILDKGTTNDPELGGLSDHFYGITCSAVYTFEL
ncbi:MAG: hypothetical protein JXA20_07010 [Spirochaetes bacterium]|nr:hypothetical protein [Spirochaetota bacterium]